MNNENQYNNYVKRVKVPYLDGYYTKEETEGLLEDKQDVLTAGANIEIDSSNTINSVTYVIDLESSSTVYSTSIEPNKMYMFGEKEGLTITELISGRTDIVNEYMFQFTSGNVATTLNVPSTVTWLNEPDIQTNKKYAVSIENNLGIIGEWSNE